VSEELLVRLRELAWLDEAPSRWTGGPAFWLQGREVVHLHEGFVEIRLTGQAIAQLDDERVMRRSRTSDWVMVRLEEVELAVDLVRRAIEANRRHPPHGASSTSSV
jgi:Family of unknown function (DUF5519)